jgi:hypothetical protein
LVASDGRVSISHALELHMSSIWTTGGKGFHGGGCLKCGVSDGDEDQIQLIIFKEVFLSYYFFKNIKIFINFN